MKQLRGIVPGRGICTFLVILALVGCAGHFAGNRSTNVDLTLLSFGSLMGETDECG